MQFGNNNSVFKGKANAGLTMNVDIQCDNNICIIKGKPSVLPKTNNAGL